MRPGAGVIAPGGESAWERVALAVAAEVPPPEIDAIWVFRPLRHERREWGTAVVARIDGERRRIYTARYVCTIKGKMRGQFSAAVEEVGSGPVAAVAELLVGVERRRDDEIATPVPVESWYPAPRLPPVPDFEDCSDHGPTRPG